MVERFKSWLQIFRRMEKQRREDLGHARICVILCHSPLLLVQLLALRAFTNDPYGNSHQK